MKIERRNKIAVVSGSFLGFIGILIGTSLVVTFPTLIKEFGIPLTTIQWLSSGYYLTATVMMSATAYIMKRLSLRKIFISASFLFLSGCLVSASAHSFLVLLLGCLLNAVATGLATPLMYQIVFYDIPSNEFGRFNGIVTMIKSFGPAFGPTYGGLLTYLISWRLIFLGVLPLLIIIFLIGIYTVPSNSINTKTASFNYGGWILFSGMLIIFSLMINKIGISLKKPGIILILLVITLILLVVFVIQDRHSQRFFLDFKILRKPLILIRALSFFSLQFMNLCLAFILPLFSEDVLHQNSMIAGLLLLPGAVIGALLSPLAGKIYDRCGSFFALMTSAILLFSGVIFYCICFNKLNMIMIILFYIVFRLGYTFGFGNLMADAGEYVTHSEHSSLSALFNTFQQYSGTIGNNLMATFISLYELFGSSKSDAVLHGGQDGMFLLLIIAISVVILTFKGKKLKNNNGK